MLPAAHHGTGTKLATSVRVPSLAPEVTSQGLVLWRLRKDRARQLWCEVKDQSSTLLIRVHNPVTSRTAVSETYDSIQLAVDRADYLRDQYTAAGWQLVDGERS